MKSFTVIMAWIMDSVFGDPEHMPHPVRLIGSFISKTEEWARDCFQNNRAAGIFIGIFVPITVYIATLLIIKIIASISIFFGAIASIIIIYYCLSTRCLADEAKSILRALEKGDFARARSRLSRIVGRDTQNLDEKEIVRATIESVSENAVDGIISPLFYAFIGGAPLAMTYKAINTLDSMIGYKNEKYRELGCFSARLDDVANFIPARLCLILIPLAALFANEKRALSSLRIGIRDGRKSPSPNSGHPEACFAGALGIQLGGECSYRSEISQKPLLGDKEREIEVADIAKSITLMWLTSAVTLILFAAVCL